MGVLEEFAKLENVYPQPKFFGFILYFLVVLLSLLSVFIGCATSAPDGTSPQGYSRVFALVCRLNFAVNQLYNFSLSFLSYQEYR
jgi:hypothetical protein